jgi:hypothetical protein
VCQCRSAVATLTVALTVGLWTVDVTLGWRTVAVTLGWRTVAMLLPLSRGSARKSRGRLSHRLDRAEVEYTENTARFETLRESCHGQLQVTKMVKSKLLFRG